MEHVPDYEVTRYAIVSKMGAVLSLRDSTVYFFRRAEEIRSMEPQAVSEKYLFPIVP